jgi:hypothetical protein
MSLGKQLTFTLPILLGSAWLLAGCYTVMRHPTTELTQAHGGDAQYNDCASCHDQGFDEPLLRDPYGYTSLGFWGYYGCPWWLTAEAGAGAPTGVRPRPTKTGAPWGPEARCVDFPAGFPRSIPRRGAAWAPPAPIFVPVRAHPERRTPRRARDSRRGAR